MTLLASRDAAAAAVPARALVFEETLGDPRSETSSTGFAAAVERDERGEFPSAACAELDAAGLRDECVAAAADPARACEPLTWMLRFAARRDVTAAFCRTASYAAALPIVLSDRVPWRREAGDVLRRGGWISCIAGPETLHAIVNGPDCILTGASECCLNVDRAEMLVVRARSPRGDLFAVADTAPARYGVIPGERLRTVGLCGADLCRVRLTDVRVPTIAIVAEGATAADLVTRSDDIAVVAIAALSLGAVDTGLRAAAAFARERRMYGATVFDIPHARSLLSGALLDLLACECVLLTAARAVGADDRDARLWCDAIAGFVFPAAAAVLQDLAVVLGARYYLREGHWHGIFEKIVRDHLMLETFYGATPERLAASGAVLRESAGQPEFWKKLEDEYGCQWNRAPEVVELGRVRALRAASAALRRWVDTSAAGDRGIVSACIRRVEARQLPGTPRQPAVDIAAAAAFLERALDENRLFSVFDVPLAPSILSPPVRAAAV